MLKRGRSVLKLTSSMALEPPPSSSSSTATSMIAANAKSFLGSSSSSFSSSSFFFFSTSPNAQIFWGKRKPVGPRDPIPTNVERIPLEETLPTDDGEPRPNSIADLTTQLRIHGSSLDAEAESDPKLQLNWSKPTPHLETPKFPGEHVVGEWPPKGRVYWKLPFKVKLQAGRVYKWCSCGASKTQPFCDGSHHSVMAAPAFDKPTKPRFRPTQFKVPETGEYWLCQCKQTDDRPFCDGTHRTAEEITQLQRPMVTDGKRIPVKIKS